MKKLLRYMEEITKVFGILNPLVDPLGHTALLKNGCEINGLQCLQIKRIVDEKAVSLAEYHFRWSL